MSAGPAYEPMRPAIVFAVCAATLVIPLVVWLISVGNPLDYFTNRVAPGQALYVLSKLCGLFALALFWLQCMTALAQFSPVLRGFVKVGRSRHAILGVTTFAFVLLHLLLFIAASSARTGHLAISVLLPAFDKGYFTTYVSLGAIAFWFLVAVVFGGWLRRRGHVSWKWVHRLSLFVFALGFLHGISIGSETRFGLMVYVYAFIALSLIAAISSWIWMHLSQRSGRAHSGEDGIGVIDSAASRFGE